MKKTLYNIVGCLAIAALASVSLTSCEKDTESNPTFHKCTSPFVLNTPALATNNTYDLANADGLELTCTQPDYGGVPYVVRYYVQVALDASAPFQELASSYTTARMKVNASELNTAMLDIYKQDHPNDVYPETARPLYVRLRACPVTVNNEALDTVYSNVITLPNVLAKYVPPTLSLSENLFLVGSSIGNGSDKGYWGWWKPFAPVFGNAGEFYSIIYVPDGGSFKWGESEGDWRGYSNVYELDDQAGAGLSENANGNIGVANGGWYTVYVESKVGPASILYTFHLYPAKAYIIGNATGDWTDSNAASEMVAPSGDGEWVSPAFTAAGELRAYIKVPGIDWWRTEFTLKGSDLFWRTMDIPDNWGANVGEEYSVQCTPGQQLKVNFSTNTGKVE